jgi:hypothetical protein
MQVQAELSRALKYYETKAARGSPVVGQTALPGVPIQAPAATPGHPAPQPAATTGYPLPQPAASAGYPPPPEYAPFQYPTPDITSSNPLEDAHPAPNDLVDVKHGPTDNATPGGVHPGRVASAPKLAGDLIDFGAPKVALTDSLDQGGGGQATVPDPNDPFAAQFARPGVTSSAAAGVTGGNAPKDEVAVEDIVPGMADLGVTPPERPPAGSTNYPTGPRI